MLNLGQLCRSTAWEMYGGGYREAFWSDWLRDVVEFDTCRRSERFEEEVYDGNEYDTQENPSRPRSEENRLLSS
jgi:hypothetical protein